VYQLQNFANLWCLSFKGVERKQDRRSTPNHFYSKGC